MGSRGNQIRIFTRNDSIYSIDFVGTYFDGSGPGRRKQMGLSYLNCLLLITAMFK